jgi:hypothetical protein
MKLINKQTVVAALFGMAATLIAVSAYNAYSRSDLAKARTVSETRTIASAGMPAADSTMGACPSMGAGGSAPASAAPAPLQWKAPDGWTDAGTKGIRLANFTAGPAGEAECYVTILSGTGGGVAMNVNRWRAQFGLADATEQEIAALPKINVLGSEAVLVDVEGKLDGQSDGVHAAGDSKDAYRLLGAIAVRPNDAVFVKMTGPSAVVAAERDKFVAFAGSLNDAAATAAGAAAPTGAAGEAECCEKEHKS